MNLREAVSYVQSQGLDSGDAYALVLHALGRAITERAWLLAHGEQDLSTRAVSQLTQAVQRRAHDEPVAYITGCKEFYGLPLAVDARVLDPRADTETLVDWTLEALANKPKARVLDLGTGSGAVALALKHQRPAWEVYAVDISADALAVAADNARRLHLTVQFAQASWLQGCAGGCKDRCKGGFTGRFDAIVSNPPYIAEGDAHLTALRHEPCLALVSGADGLNAIRSIVSQAPARLVPGGWLLLEHGYNQAVAVRHLLGAAGLVTVQSRRDLAGIERCSGAQSQAA
ncbi:MAG: peptide chain release factor N(5)-glutamine methyltransferase [Rhodoferax sp.]|nr:peptide chain release factor N(5)-glutamine methyltransferase [Rhodoferax sp.]